VVPGLGLGFGLGFASSDIAVEDGSEDLVRVRRICSVLATHEDCLPFCISEGGSPQTSPPQTSQYNSDPYVRACCSRSWCNTLCFIALITLCDKYCLLYRQVPVQYSAVFEFVCFLLANFVSVLCLVIVIL
jgi:hypothetical protein